MQVEPAFGVDHDIHDAGRLHPLGDQGVDPRGGLDDFGARRFAQNQAAIDDLSMGVFRESGVDVPSPLSHGGFEHRHKGAGIGLDAGDLAIAAHLLFKGFVIDQLLAVVVIALAVLDEEIARLQVVLDGMHDCQFKIPAVDGLCPALA